MKRISWIVYIPQFYLLYLLVRSIHSILVQQVQLQTTVTTLAISCPVSHEIKYFFKDTLLPERDIPLAIENWRTWCRFWEPETSFTKFSSE